MKEKKILVVDDDDHFTSFLCDSMREKGFYVLKAYDGEQALRLIESNKPDLILLDIAMPGIDGFEVCKIVSEKYSIPVILISALHDAETITRAEESSATFYMPKPIRLSDLIKKVNLALKKK